MIDNNEVNVYRIVFKTGVAQNLKRVKKEDRKSIEEVFKYCNEKNIMALGWSLDLNYYNGNLKELQIDQAMDMKKKEKEANKIDILEDRDYKSFVDNMDCLKKIKKDDIVWTRVKDKYYVGRITNDKYKYWNAFDKENAEKFDVRHTKECRFYEVGGIDKVPGVIINAFTGPSHTLSAIGNNENKEFIREYSKYIFNEKCEDNSLKYTNINTNFKTDDFWQIIKDQEAEELVSLYLQKIEKYNIFITTKRRSTPKYEFVLVNDKGQNAVVQVKTGNRVLRVEDYENEREYDKVFLFSTNKEQDKESKNSTEKVEVITREKLKKFVYSNWNLLPKYLIDEFKLFNIL